MMKKAKKCDTFEETSAGSNKRVFVLLWCINCWRLGNWLYQQENKKKNKSSRINAHETNKNISRVNRPYSQCFRLFAKWRQIIGLCPIDRRINV